MLFSEITSEFMVFWLPGCIQEKHPGSQKIDTQIAHLSRELPFPNHRRHTRIHSNLPFSKPSFWVSILVFGKVYLQNVTWHYRFVGDPSVYWLKPINLCATRKPLVREHAHMRRRLAGRFIAASVSSSLSAKKCRTSSKLSLSCQMGCIFHMFLKGVMMGDVCFCEFQINSITKPAKPTPDLHL